MKNILVPIGTSNTAVNCLQYAIDLAHETDANVYAVSVFPEMSNVAGMTRVNTILKTDSENRLKEVLDQVDKKDVSVIAHPIKGGVIEGITRFNKHVPVDLMVVSPKSNSIAEELYLGNTTGKLLKETNIPMLIVPKNTTFKKPKVVLMAFKNGNFKKEKTLNPVREFIKFFDVKVNVLHVSTPETTAEMQIETENIKGLQHSYQQVDSATTFQAVIEYFHQNEPDMVCVVRRKRGFFQKLMEKNTILKREFHTSKPLLVLQVQK